MFLIKSKKSKADPLPLPFKEIQKNLPLITQPTKTEKERIKKETKSALDGRWTIFILFLFTLIASLFFYLRRQLPLMLEKFLTPQVVISKPVE